MKNQLLELNYVFGGQTGKNEGVFYYSKDCKRVLQIVGKQVLVSTPPEFTSPAEPQVLEKD